MVTRREQAAERMSPADALLTLAASLQDSASAEEALDRLTNGLAERGIATALLLQPQGGGDLQVERSTLALVPDVWGRPLRLPRLAAAITRGRPLVEGDIQDALTEAGGRPLLSGDASGTLIAAPLRAGAGRDGVLCLASRSLTGADASAAWGLALQLGAALRDGAPSTPVDAITTPQDQGNGAGHGRGELSLFDRLTRKLSYSLSGDEVVRAGLEVLAPALGFHWAVSVTCRDGEDATTVYTPGKGPSDTAAAAADAARDAFAQLTGDKHAACSRPAFEIVELPGASTNGASERILDAPLVTEGDVTGLLRVAAGEPDAATERTFYTVANQVSLALERVNAQRIAERAHLASLAESLSDGIVLVDAALQVTSLNGPAKECLEARTGEAMAEGSALSDATLAELAQQALSSQQPTALRELPAHESGSSRRYLMAMAAPMAGSPEGSAAVVILRDVTDEHLMQERLLQSEKMVSVGQLVSGVAHELNNPLTGITGFAQLLLARDLDESTARDVETIHTEAERASKIVQNLLSFARRKRTEKELANLNVLIERVLELRVYDLRVKNIELELDLDPQLPETMVDANQIQQVFFNVIVNAEQAMAAEHGEGQLTVRTRAEGDNILVSFQDDGAGIDEETKRRIFDPFFTTKETGEGTGLGLTISYGIIDEHGGRIWPESAPGRGTTFMIELPIVQGVEAPAPPEEAEPATSVAGHSILVVDDEESIQRLLGSILTMDGHRVDIARNGREALERIGRSSYDMVITDIKMPDLDGRGLYEQIVERDKRLAEHTVFITGDTVNRDTRDFLQRVTNPCLAKPFTVRQVRDTISAVLANGN